MKYVTKIMLNCWYKYIKKKTFAYVYKLCYLILLTISSVEHHVVRSSNLFANCYSAEKEKCILSKLLDVICKTMFAYEQIFR